MPQESRLFVKTSLAALVVAFAWGAVMAIGEAFGHPADPVWAVEHAHLAFVGWLVNIVIGIAWWFLPLARDAFPATAGRYPARVPFAVWALLNGGLVLRIVSEPNLAHGALPRIVLAVASIAQVAAIALFAYTAWRRVRAPSRPAPGVR